MAASLVERIEKLAAVGVQVGHDYEYRGKPGVDRVRHVLPDTVAGVSLPFTPTEWCSIAMREPPDHIESNYVGGCCGNMGVVQDTINGVFRDGGYVSADDLQTLGHYLRSHDGWERFSGDFDVDAFLTPEAWAATNGLDPWDKVCVIHAALEEALKLPRDDKPQGTPQNPDYEKDRPGRRTITTLYNTLARIEWSDLFSGPGSDDDPKSYRPSHKLQRQMALARVVQPTRDLLGLLGDIADEEFHGFALVTPGTDEVLDNRSGLCIYNSREAAQNVIDLWSKWETDESARERHGEDEHEPVFVKPDCEIVAVTVTVADGLKVIR